MKIRIHFHRAGLMVMFTLWLSQSAQGQNPDSVMNIARNLAAGQEYSRALALVTDLHRAYPENQDYIIYLARLYYWSKEYAKAKELLIPLTLPEPAGQEAYDLMIQVEYQLGAYPAVIEKCQRGKALFPTQVHFYGFQEALALEKTGKDEEAKKILDEIPATAPNRRDAVYLRTQILRKQKNTIAAGYLNTSFNNPGFAPWHLAHLEYFRKTSSFAIGGRLNYGHLFGADAVQIEADAYPRIGKSAYLFLNAGYSGAERIFPRYRLGGEFFQDIGRYNFSIGSRYLDFKIQEVLLLTGSAAINYGDWKIGYRNYVLRAEKEWIVSHVLNFRKSLEYRESYIQLDLQYGGTPYYFFASDDFSRISAWRAGINGVFRIGDHTFLQPVLMYEREEYIPDTYRNRFNVQWIISKRF